ncbi:hypothetical protein SprV_0401700100 [Sparganum proliferum]
MQMTVFFFCLILGVQSSFLQLNEDPMTYPVSEEPRNITVLCPFQPVPIIDQTVSALDSKNFYHESGEKRRYMRVLCAVKTPKHPLGLKLSVFLDGRIYCSLNLQRADPCDDVTFDAELDMVYLRVKVENDKKNLERFHSVVCKANGTYGPTYITHYVSFGSNPYIQ